MNKKGLSGVVTTVLIILLSVIAVIILWQALKPTIENSASGAGAAVKCAQASLSVACTKNTTGATVSITRGGGLSENVDILASVSDGIKSGSGSKTNVGPIDTAIIGINAASLTSNATAQAVIKLADGTLCPTTTKAVCV